MAFEAMMKYLKKFALWYLKRSGRGINLEMENLPTNLSIEDLYQKTVTLTQKNII